ncbi:MAG: minor capsid protein, partial [Endomicrobium sp.]|nr:minor capsid protein [Endomicrobium sp.]
MNEKLLKELALEILDTLKRELFNPLIEPLKIKIEVKENSLESEIIKALKKEAINITKNQDTGRFYIKGVFNAKLSAELEKVGGIYIRSAKGYRIESIPPNVQIFLSNRNNKIDSDINKVLQVLENLNYKHVSETYFKNTIGNIDYQLNNVFGGKNRISEQEKQDLNRDYSNRLGRHIQNWEEEQIAKMREDLLELKLIESKSRKDIENYFIDNFNTSKNKAVFLARQESSLMLSDLTTNRYKQDGIKYFKWSTSKDARVRDTHKELQGKIFE